MEGSKLNQIEHEFVPLHERISEEETEQLLQEYGIKRLHLPKINLTDPAIKKSGVDRGDVIKITRKSPTAGTTTYYRVVI